MRALTLVFALILALFSSPSHASRTGWVSAVYENYGSVVESLPVPFYSSADNRDDVAQQYCATLVLKPKYVSIYSSANRCIAVREAQYGGDTQLFATLTIKYEDCPNDEVFTADGCGAPQCEEGETIDPVTGECVPEDGECPEGQVLNSQGVCAPSIPSDSSACDSNLTCLSEFEDYCAGQGAEIWTYNYLGGGVYNGTCGYVNQSCPSGSYWNASIQVCVQNPAPDDPSPPDTTTDTDNDGVPDTYDPEPSDPDVYKPVNNAPPLYYTPATPPTVPVGASTEFNDTAIVDSVNRNTAATEFTTKELADLNQKSTVSNDILNDISNTSNSSKSLLDDIKDLLTVSTGDVIDNNGTEFDSTADGIIDDAFEQLNDLSSKTFDESGGRGLTASDVQYIDTFIGSLPLADCINPVIYNQELNFCSKAATINEWLYWIVAAITIIALFHDTNDTLRRK